jgi:Fe-S cluster assembly ATP-binding protein
MTNQPTLSIRNLSVEVDSKLVLNGISLDIPRGEIHAIMGPNGSGKTTLSQVIMGHPKYVVTGGELLLNGEDLLALTPDKRAQLGLFLAFQYPKEIPGIKLLTFLRSIYNTRTKQRLTIMQFKKVLAEYLAALKMDEAFLERYLNAGFSGGEKKKVEMLQLALLQPDIAILDETDSGLDVDALRVVCQSVQTLKQSTDLGILLITHYNRILDYITPDYVHVLIDGKIVRSGGKEFAKEVEAKGYDWLKVDGV